MLALLLAPGLRRHDAVVFTFDHLQKREEHWAIVDLLEKGSHVRTVPLPDWAGLLIEEWLTAAGAIQGRVYRRVNKLDRFEVQA